MSRTPASLGGGALCRSANAKHSRGLGLGVTRSEVMPLPRFRDQTHVTPIGAGTPRGFTACAIIRDSIANLRHMWPFSTRPRLSPGDIAAEV